MLAVFVAGAALPDGPWSRLVVVTIQGVALLLAFSLTQRRGWMFHASRAVVVAAVAVAAVEPLTGTRGDTASGLTFLVGGLLVALAPLAVIDAVRHHPRVELRTVLAALTLYVLFGLFFSYVYNAIATFDDAAFASTQTLDSSTFQYLSFITLTTVGYGDITPATDFTRTLTVLEALLGQIYLVTIVALLVGNLGRPRRHVDDLE